MGFQQDNLAIASARRSRLVRTLVAASMPVCSATSAQTCEWESIAGVGLSGRVRTMTLFDDGRGSALYVGGHFYESRGDPGNRVARWDGQSWEPLGTGLGSVVFALTEFDDGNGLALYAGGWFMRAGNVAETNRIARWDGHEWSALGSGMFSMGQYGRDDSVLALAVFDDGIGPALYAGGHFDEAGGVPAMSIAKWDGIRWSAVGSGLTNGFGDAGEVRALAVYDDGSGPALYAAGAIYSIGATVGSLVRWKGQEWEPVGGGVTSFPDTLGVFDDGTGPGLYIGGQVYTVGTLGVNRIARWNGHEWASPGGGTDHSVLSLGVFDDGRGPALYAGGSFFRAGGILSLGIARWDGQVWEALGEGLWNTNVFGPSVNSIATYNDGSGPALYVGGNFSEAGGIPAQNIARWKCNTCYADCDTQSGPGILDIFDFLCFGNRFAASDPYACDCDTSTGTGICDIFDFLCFGNAFNKGCQ